MKIINLEYTFISKGPYSMIRLISFLKIFETGIFIR